MSRTRAGTAQGARGLLVGLLLGIAACMPAGPGETPWQAEGTIQVIDGRTWVVGPHLVTLAPDAAVVGVPAVGASAKLTGTLGTGGQAVARQVEIAPAAQPPPPTVAPPRSEPTTRPTAQPTTRPAIQPTAEPTRPARPKPAPVPRRGRDDDD